MLGTIIAAQRGDIDAVERVILRHALGFLNSTNLKLAPLLPKMATYNEVTSHLPTWGAILARGSESDVTLVLPDVKKAIDVLMDKGTTNRETSKIAFRNGWKLVRAIMENIQLTMSESQRTQTLRVPFETDLLLLKETADGRGTDGLVAMTLLKDVLSRLMTLTIKRRSRMVEEEEIEDRKKKLDRFVPGVGNWR